MRKNQKGFSLVELLIATSILAIVMIAVCSFMVVGTKSYASVNNEVTVQQEAQLALNQISDVVIDTTRSINYAGYSGGTAVQAKKDSEFGFDPEYKELTVMNGKEETDPTDPTKTIVVDGNGNKNYRFLWDRDQKVLFFAQVDVDLDFSDPTKFTNEVLAERVENFSVDLSQEESNRVILVTMDFEMDGKKYTTSNNITVRNKVALNDVEINPLDAPTTIIVTPKKAAVVLEPGETYTFDAPKVTGKRLTDKTVKWSVDWGNHPNDWGTTFIDEDNGIIKIAPGETKDNFNVIITTNAVDSNGNHGTASVLVYVKRAHSVNMTKTDGEGAENNAQGKLTAGQKFTINANVDGVKLGVTCDSCHADTSKDQQVIDAGTYQWEVIEGANLLTLISKDTGKAEYQISTEAKLDNRITIRATSWHSVQSRNGSVYGPVQGTITLTVGKEKSTKNFGIWEYGKTLWDGRDFDDFFDTSRFGDHNPHGRSTGDWLMFVRIRDKGTSFSPADKIIVYRTQGQGGTNINSGVLGLDPTKSYEISMELMDPGRDFNAGMYKAMGANAPCIKDYFAHLDSSGAYNGTEYASAGMAKGQFNPPSLAFNYYWNNNLTSDAGLADGSRIGPINMYLGGEFGLKAKEVGNAADNRYLFDDNVGFKAYFTKAGTNREVYVFAGGAKNNYDGRSQCNLSNCVNFEGFHNAVGNYAKTKFVNNQAIVGKYRYVPMLVFQNKQEQVYDSDVYYINYTRDFGEKIIELPQSAIEVEVEMKNPSNVLGVSFNGKRCMFYFPTPSSPDFPFKPGDNKKVVDWGYSKTLKFFNMDRPEENPEDVSGLKLIGTYVAGRNGAKGYYVVELQNYRWYPDPQGYNTFVKLRCNEDGTDWQVQP